MVCMAWHLMSRTQPHREPPTRPNWALSATHYQDRDATQTRAALTETERQSHVTSAGGSMVMMMLLYANLQRRPNTLGAKTAERGEHGRGEGQC